MYIGSLSKPQSNVKIKTTYYKRGTTHKMPPDGTLNDYNSSNGLLSKPVFWNWNSVLETGVDIHMSFSQKCFIDNVLIKQSKDSVIKSVSVLYKGKNANYMKAGKYEPKTDGFLEQRDIKVLVALSCDSIIIRLESCLKNIVLEELDVFGSTFDGAVIYPIPNKIEYESSNNYMAVPKIIIADWADADVSFAANLLKEKTSKYCSLVMQKENHNSNNAFIIRKCNHSVLGNIQSEKYEVHSKNGSVEILASDRSGLIYGVEAVLQMINDDKIMECQVTDSPYMPLRGVHLGLPPREAIPFFYRLIRYLLVPMHINTIFLQITAGMRFDSHPEINEAWRNAVKKSDSGEWPKLHHSDMIAGGKVLEKTEVADLIEYARSYGIEVIPEIQSLSHVQYITLAHPELAETSGTPQETLAVDKRSTDQPPNTFYHHSYCPSNEECYKLIFELIDEIIEVVRPTKYVHMGHDECYQIGICPKCKDKEPADLFAIHVRIIYEYLKKKNLKMMIWGDMLQNTTRYKTSPAIDKIPKDIILLDFIWYFSLNHDIEDHLLNHGFQVAFGNLYSSHFPRFENRIRKKGIIGGEISTWCRLDEKVLGQKGKLYDMIYTANALWSDKYDSNMRCSYEKIINNLMPKIRSDLQGVMSPSLDKSVKREILHLPTPYEKPSPELVEAINSAQPIVLRGISFDTSNMQQIPPGNKIIITEVGNLESIIFLHSASQSISIVPSSNLEKIGWYTINFGNGTSQEIPIEYGICIASWNKRALEPMKMEYYRHAGYSGTYFADPYVEARTPSGDYATLYGFEWINTSHKEITSIECYTCSDAESDIILAGAVGIRCSNNCH